MNSNSVRRALGAMRLSLPLAVAALALLLATAAAGAARAGSAERLAAVRGCADVLLEKGRDRYGEVVSPLFMANLDAETLDSPRELPPLDEAVRTEGRGHRRNPGGSDLWEDQSLLRVLRRLTELTGDARYEAAAREYVADFLERCRKPDTGLPSWGTHLYWDAYRDAPGGDNEGRGPHEILIREPDWEFMWSVAPERVRDRIERMWEWHMVDRETGLFNRHDDRMFGCDFAFKGGELALAFAFLHSKTGEAVWRERARLVANWHWNARNPETGLAPDAPGIRNRFDGSHCFTTLPGPHASLLLRAAEIDADDELRGIALGHLRAWARHAWDPAAGRWNAMLKLDGTPVPEEANRPPRRIDVYEDFEPTGEIELWRTIMYSYEFPLIAAQSFALAAEGAPGDAELVEATRRWAETIERELPPSAGRRWKHLLAEALPGLEEKGGTYAENYARAIDFLQRAAAVLGEPRRLDAALGLADEAIAKLRRPSGLFVGHPAKNTYEATDGVGYLLLALLNLDAKPEERLPNF